MHSSPFIAFYNMVNQQSHINESTITDRWVSNNSYHNNSFNHIIQTHVWSPTQISQSTGS